MNGSFRIIGIHTGELIFLIAHPTSVEIRHGNQSRHFPNYDAAIGYIKTLRTHQRRKYTPEDAHRAK